MPTKILLSILTLFSVSLFVYLVIVSRPVNVGGEDTNMPANRQEDVDSAPPAAAVVDEDGYREGAREVFLSVKELVAGVTGLNMVSSTTAEDGPGGGLREDAPAAVASLKARIAEMRAPAAEYKDLHLNLLLVLNGLEIYLAGGGTAADDIGPQRIEELEEEYGWLKEE